MISFLRLMVFGFYRLKRCENCPESKTNKKKINKHFSLLHVGTFVFHSVYYQFKHICCQQIRSMTLLIKHLNAKRWQQVQESHFDGRYDNCCCLNGKLWLMWFFLPWMYWQYWCFLYFMSRQTYRDINSQQDPETVTVCCAQELQLTFIFIIDSSFCL